MVAAGTVSYSVYLMHGLIMNAFLSIFGTGTGHNVFIILSVFLIAAISAITYLFIEKPFMHGWENKHNTINKGATA